LHLKNAIGANVISVGCYNLIIETTQLTLRSARKIWIGSVFEPIKAI